MAAEHPVVEAEGLTRIHTVAGSAVRSLDGVSLAVAPGEIVAVTGPSGSGKSTLLFLLGGLDVPDGGVVRMSGVDWATLQGAERARFRLQMCGFVVQGMALLPQATAVENVEVPLLLAGGDAEERRRAATEALEHVDMGAHTAKLPDQLSGGEQQRVAIARALIAEPAVVLADEPTGNLDSATGDVVVRLLVDVAAERGAAVVLITHDPAVARHADRVVELHSGRLARESSVDELARRRAAR